MRAPCTTHSVIISCAPPTTHSFATVRMTRNLALATRWSRHLCRMLITTIRFWSGSPKPGTSYLVSRKYTQQAEGERGSRGA